MHIYFSGIGGAGIGPLALIAHQAGYDVSGSDSQPSQYTEMLLKEGINLHIGQSSEQIAAVNAKKPINWIVFSSAVMMSSTEHPELLFALNNNLKYSKRDELLNKIINDNRLKLIAVAGTHGKTTTTAMVIWLLKELGIPVSYSVGAKIGSKENNNLEAMGKFDSASEYFVYECDEFDRNFLSFKPYLSLITVVDWDHHDIYPTRDDYQLAFRQFIGQSQNTFLLQKDADYLGVEPNNSVKVVNISNEEFKILTLPGIHNRQNASVVVESLGRELKVNNKKLFEIINRFPGLSRRFEQLAPNIYSDYAHTPEEIASTLQMASELSNDVVVVYEPLTNRRQYYMKELYKNIFEPAKKVYWLPSYLAREDPHQELLSPEKLISYLNNQTKAEPANMDERLLGAIKNHALNGDLVLCMAGGGGGSLDEWLRKNLPLTSM